MSWLFSRVENAPFHDKAWKRADLAEWDERWQRLSLPARRHLLDDVKAGSPTSAARPLNRASVFPAPVVAELRGAGFISPEDAGPLGTFIVPTAVLGWLTRLRALRRFALLDPDQPSQFDRYVSLAFATFELGQVVAEIVERQTSIGRYRLVGDPFELFVRRQRWPDWVADHFADPLARPLIDAIEKAGAPVPLPRLEESVPGHDGAAVRATLDRLVNHLALFEDLHPDTLDIQVGLLPEVARARRKARLTPPPRLEPAQPVELGPEGGIDVPDLRAFLLEVAGHRPRLRRDSSLFQKEQERFLAALDALPAWLRTVDDEQDRQERLQAARRWAYRLQLVQSVKGRDRAQVLDLTPQGLDWLGHNREAQYGVLFDALRNKQGTSDAIFLGSSVQALLVADDRGDGVVAASPVLSAKQKQPLREALVRLFAELTLGTFYPVERFLAWASHVPRNPLLLGRTPAEVAVRVEDRLVPPLEEHLQEAARTLLRHFLNARLVGLGCVQMARDDRGQLLLACLPRLDAYFGKATARAADAASHTRVLVQPDFSIVVIGLDAAPAADLAPFCDRVRGSAGQGSLTFRLSRASLFRGLAGGLEGEEVLARLRRHASNDLPANVLTEVRGWCAQARTVDVAPATLVRCPDAETAARVASALGKLAERVGERVVALEGEGLTPGMRQKLEDEGVLLGEVKRRK